MKPKREIKKIDDFSSHYSHVTWCWNCGKRNYCYVPKGTPLKDCDPIVCDNCGCDIYLAKKPEKTDPEFMEKL